MTLAFATTVRFPRAEVADTPLGVTLASQSNVGVPTAEVPTCYEGVTLALAMIETVPNALVAATPVRVTGTGSPQAPSPQVPRPQPVILAIRG